MLEGIHFSQCFVENGNVLKELKVTHRQNERRMGRIFTSITREINNRSVKLDQYSAGDKIERMKWAGSVVRMGEERGCIGSWLGNWFWRRPLGRPRRTWVDNITMYLQEVAFGYMDWIGLAQDRDRWRTLVSAVMNLRVQWNGWNSLTSCKKLGFSKENLYHRVSKNRYPRPAKNPM